MLIKRKDCKFEKKSKSYGFERQFSYLHEERKTEPRAKCFMLWFKHANHEPTWDKTLNHDKFTRLKNASFPQRSNCNVKLYQDVPRHSTSQPPVDFHEEGPRNLWVDVFKAINDHEADIPQARGVKIGELLKQKEEEGVAVRIFGINRNDETSFPFIKNKGVMGTHDEDAFDYFKQSKFICRFNKYINNSSRELTSFIDGVDPCDGRYDTEEHSLFQTLNDEADILEFYHTSIACASLQNDGPREPWHDAHACLIGEATWDVLSNFEQRWSKQCNPSLFIHTNDIQNLLHSSQPQQAENQVGNWKVQVFRSIDRILVSLQDSLAVECNNHEFDYAVPILSAI
ncbi:hypothetical protein MKX01_042810 [Papaver californicum]|nr:hypothetical protein MKX01_042810 [Papaver californicum]